MKVKRSVLFLALAALVAALFTFNYYLWQLQANKKQRIDGLRSQVALHLQENTTLDERNTILTTEVDMLRSPDSYFAFEEKAREDYGMIGQNETFFVLPESEMAGIADVPGLNEQSQPVLREPANHGQNTDQPALTLEALSDAEQTETGIPPNAGEVKPIAVSPVPLQLESLQ